MIVVDASAVVEVLVQSTAAEGIERRIRRRDDSLHAPHLIDVEVVHALRGLLRRREIELGRAEQARSSLASCRHAPSASCAAGSRLGAARSPDPL
ncbi:MAG TPA: type II toxin-antitoxin system VapC family toxin [Candidatus Dormibacteraeota bacterium]|nr:type II toxin-antitoxin system VapC family toxin [Candidatus Dormibacteraeota bacterium]